MGGGCTELDSEGLGSGRVLDGDGLFGVLAVVADFDLNRAARSIREGGFTGSISTGFEVSSKIDGGTLDGFVGIVFDFYDDAVAFSLEGLVARDVLGTFFIGSLDAVVEGGTGNEDLGWQGDGMVGIQVLLFGLEAVGRGSTVFDDSSAFDGCRPGDGSRVAAYVSGDNAGRNTSAWGWGWLRLSWLGRINRTGRGRQSGAGAGTTG